MQLSWWHVTTNENYRIFYPLGYYLLEVSNRNTRARCKIFKVNIKDTKKTSNGVVLVALLLTLYFAFANSIEFEHINAGEQNFSKKMFLKIVVL